MVTKVLEILSSVRFWQVVAATVVLYCSKEGVVDPNLANAVAQALGASVVIGTVDRFNK